MTDKTPEEQATLDMADHVATVFSHWESLGATGWEDDGKIVEALRDLSETVDDLHASHKPKGVKPEEVEPATRFKFARDTHEDANIYTMLDPFRNTLMALVNGTGLVAINLEDRIVPIQTECEHEYVRDIKACYSIVCKKCGEPFP